MVGWQSHAAVVTCSITIDLMLFILIMDGTLMWLDGKDIRNWRCLADIVLSVDKHKREHLESRQITTMEEK